MKTKRIFLMAFAAMLSVGMVSCGKDDANDSSSNADSNVQLTSGDWIDMGLPSGLLWASCNVGASRPEAYGDMYAWGETESKSEYSWKTYKYCTVNSSGDLLKLKKYNTDSYLGTVDNYTVLKAGDDAARVALGNGAYTPTINQWSELIDHTTAKWIKVNGVEGTLLTAANGNTLFLPAAGLCVNSSQNIPGYDGCYWSSSLYSEHPERAFRYHFKPDDQHITASNRCYGFSVRAVRKK